MRGERRTGVWAGRSIDDRSLMRLHVEALFVTDVAGRLVTINESGGGPAPRLFVGRTDGGICSWFGRDLDGSLVGELRRLLDDVPADRPLSEGSPALAPVLRRLEREHPLQKIWSGPAFRFPEGMRVDGDAVRITPEKASVLVGHFEEWVPDTRAGMPLYAVIESGAAVSLCCSVRVTRQAHEAGVETHPAFRGRGHAGRAVRAWAAHVAAEGRVPLYSTSWENAASLSVARKLGLVQFGDDFHVT